MSNKPINRTLLPVIMWPQSLHGQRSAWIQPRAVRGTRSIARSVPGYGEPDCRKKALEHVRFARVIVSEAPNE